MERSRSNSWLVPLGIGLLLGYALACGRAGGWQPEQTAQAQSRKPLFRGQSAVLLERIAQSVDQIARSVQHIERQLRGKDARQQHGSKR